MYKLIYPLLILTTLSLYSLDYPDIVIYEKTPHSKEMIKKLERGKKDSIEIYHTTDLPLEDLFDDHKESKILILITLEGGYINFKSYNIKKKKPYIFLKKENKSNIFYKTISKLILIYDLEQESNLTIFQAIKNNDLEIIKRLDLNKRNYRGMNPLNYALYLKKYNLIPFLSINDKYFYEADDLGITPLHRILEKGDLELFKKYYNFLLKNGEISSGKTFLHFAATSGNIELVKYLLNKKISNKKTKNDETILHFAATSGNIELIKFILKNYPQFKITDRTRDNRNILHYAISSKNINFVKKIITILKNKKFDIKKNQFDNNRKNYLFYAFLTGNIKFSKQIKKIGFKFENIDKILFYLINENPQNGIEMIKNIIKENNIDIYKNGKFGIPVLHMARYLELSEFKKIVTDIKKLTTIEDSNGLNVLNYAVLGGNFNSLIYFKNLGMDINHLTKDKENLLYFAIIGKYKQILFYLLNIGVKTNIKLLDDINLLHVIASEGDVWFYNMIKKYNPKLELTPNKFGEFPVHFAVKSGNLKLVKKIIINNQMLIYLYDSLGNDLIKVAIYTKQYEILKFLLSFRPRLDIPNAKHKTAKDIAIETKNKKALLLLSQQKAKTFKELEDF